jgi:hypothetical protein
MKNRREQQSTPENSSIVIHPIPAVCYRYSIIRAVAIMMNLAGSVLRAPWLSLSNNKDLGAARHSLSMSTPLWPSLLPSFNDNSELLSYQLKTGSGEFWPADKDVYPDFEVRWRP